MQCYQWIWFTSSSERLDCFCLLQLAELMFRYNVMAFLRVSQLLFHFWQQWSVWLEKWLASHCVLLFLNHCSVTTNWIWPLTFTHNIFIHDSLMWLWGRIAKYVCILVYSWIILDIGLNLLSMNWRAPWKNANISIYFFFFRPSLSGVLFLMLCLLVEGECQCQILMF